MKTFKTKPSPNQLNKLKFFIVKIIKKNVIKAEIIIESCTPSLNF